MLDIKKALSKKKIEDDSYSSSHSEDEDSEKESVEDEG